MSDGNTLWAWQCQESDGKWSLVGAMVGGKHMPLIGRSRAAINATKALAESHAKATGQPLRLAQFDMVDVWSKSE